MIAYGNFSSADIFFHRSPIILPTAVMLLRNSGWLSNSMARCSLEKMKNACMGCLIPAALAAAFLDSLLPLMPKVAAPPPSWSLVLEPFAGFGGGTVGNCASSTSRIARRIESHPSLIVSKSLSNAEVGDWSDAPSVIISGSEASYGSLGESPAFSFSSASARSHPSAPIVCTAGMSNLAKNRSLLRLASTSIPLYPAAHANAASMATLV